MAKLNNYETPKEKLERQKEFNRTHVAPPMKASPRLQARIDAVKKYRDEHEGGHSPGFPLGFTKKKKEVAKKMKPKSGLEDAIEARKAMIKRGDIGELLNYGAMRQRQKGNYMFENPDKTIKRIKANPHDSRYND